MGFSWILPMINQPAIGWRIPHDELETTPCLANEIDCWRHSMAAKNHGIARESPPGLVATQAMFTWNLGDVWWANGKNGKIRKRFKDHHPKYDLWVIIYMCLLYQKKGEPPNTCILRVYTIYLKLGATQKLMIIKIFPSFFSNFGGTLLSNKSI